MLNSSKLLFSSSSNVLAKTFRLQVIRRMPGMIINQNTFMTSHLSFQEEEQQSEGILKGAKRFNFKFKQSVYAKNDDFEKDLDKLMEHLDPELTDAAEEFKKILEKSDGDSVKDLEKLAESLNARISNYKDNLEEMDYNTQPELHNSAQVNENRASDKQFRFAKESADLFNASLYPPRKSFTLLSKIQKFKLDHPEIDSLPLAKDFLNAYALLITEFSLYDLEAIYFMQTNFTPDLLASPRSIVQHLDEIKELIHKMKAENKEPVEMRQIMVEKEEALKKAQQKPARRFNKKEILEAIQEVRAEGDAKKGETN